MKQKTFYSSPSAEKFEETLLYAVLCQSGGIESTVDDFTVDPDDINF